MTVAELYNQLFTGKKFELSFVDNNEAQCLRTALHRYKKTQDDAMLGTGLISAEEVQSFYFHTLRINEDYTTYLVYFGNKRKLRQYDVKVVDEVVELVATEETADGS